MSIVKSRVNSYLTYNLYVKCQEMYNDKEDMRNLYYARVASKPFCN